MARYTIAEMRKCVRQENTSEEVGQVVVPANDGSMMDFHSLAVNSRCLIRPTRHLKPGQITRRVLGSPMTNVELIQVNDGAARASLEAIARSVEWLASVRNEGIASKRIVVQLADAWDFADIPKLNSIARFPVDLRRIEFQEQYLEKPLTIRFGRVVDLDINGVEWPIAFDGRNKFTLSLNNLFDGSVIRNGRRRMRNASAEFHQDCNSENKSRGQHWARFDTRSKRMT
jgi:hypothetical protein